MGYWSPETFIKEVGVNVYALQKYNPKKIPILFIHGATGSPRDFQYIAQRIDPDRYQPWFFYYPSGVEIEKIADMLYKKLRNLHRKYRFKTLIITAHSIGGLVARSFINKYVEENEYNYLKCFISMATPYGGNDMSRMGVEHSPVVIPSWNDVATNSAFLQSLHHQKLPPQLKFYLFFGYAGNNRWFGDINDGSISLKSQLAPEAKSEAVMQYGFDADHTNILTSDELIEKYRQVLKKEYNGRSAPVVAELPKPDNKKIAGDDPFRAYVPITRISNPIPPGGKELDCYQTENHITDITVQKYMDMLQSTESRNIIMASKQICRSYPENTELIETAHSVLLNNYNRHVDKGDHIDAMSWLCKVLGGSGHTQFKATLHKIALDTTNEKLKKYARQNIKRLTDVKRQPMRTISSCLRGNCINGEGTTVFADGSRYTGGFKNRLMSGFGYMTWPDGSSYKGQWVNKQIKGTGVFTYTDGAVYEGDVSQNMRHGRGTMSYPNGIKYVGEYRKDLRHGPATPRRDRQARRHSTPVLSSPNTVHANNDLNDDVFPNGQTYIGVWKQLSGRRRSTGRCISGNCRSGKGVMLFSDGMKYNGQFRRSCRHGYGVGSYSDRSIYYGSWHRNVRHGHGTMIFTDGTKFIGSWKANKRHGRGTMIFTDGSKFIGIFAKDMRHGKGTVILADGTQYNGIWRRHQMISRKKTDRGNISHKPNLYDTPDNHLPDDSVYVHAFKNKPAQKTSNTAFWIFKGNTHYQAGDYNLAVDCFNKILEKFPNHKTALINRATANLKKELYGKAINDLKKAMETGSESPIMYNNLGIAWAKKGYYELALIYFNHALEVKPDCIDGLNNRGCIWVKMGEPEKAVHDFNKIIERDRHNHLAYYNRGCVWAKRRKFKAALADAENAVKLKPDQDKYRHLVKALITRDHPRQP
jgi:tetratricopeptide (TPR) repeat protein/uncharacterized alpha/beta hydrolase family protein